MGPLTFAQRFNLRTSIVLKALLPRWAIEVLSAVCACWSLAAPLLLWIAWSPPIWKMVLYSALAAIVLTGFFASALMPDEFSEPSTLDPKAADPGARDPRDAAPPHAEVSVPPRRKTWRDSA